MPVVVSEAGAGPGVHFDGFTYQGALEISWGFSGIPTRSPKNFCGFSAGSHRKTTVFVSWVP